MAYIYFRDNWVMTKDLTDIIVGYCGSDSDSYRMKYEMVIADIRPRHYYWIQQPGRDIIYHQPSPRQGHDNMGYHRELSIEEWHRLKDQCDVYILG